jgi:hypothetical protein
MFWRKDRISRHKIFAVASAIALFLLAGCGIEDYQKPVKQFQDGSTIVISAAREMLNHVNIVEQNAAIDQAVFEHKPIDIDQIRSLQLVTPPEIDVRTKALDQLNAYAANLGGLASGKAVSDISTQTDKLSKALDGLAKEASGLPASKATFISNPRFGKSLDLLAAAFGALARVLAEHKARAELEKSIADTKQPIDSLLDLLQQELEGAYARQQATLGAQQVYFLNMYKDERSGGHPDSTRLLLLGDRIKSYLQQKAALDAAAPGPSVTAMRTAHAALVNYAQSKHDPKTLKELLDAAQAFYDRVKPFGDALQAFLTAK